MSVADDRETVECVVQLEHKNEEQAVFRTRSKDAVPEDVGMLSQDLDELSDDITLELGRMYEAKVTPSTETVEELLGPGV